MTEKIQKILTLIEQKHQVKIIYACESGSRAWGFESEDSDWDIRFIYLSSLDHYLSVFPNIPEVLDINNSSIIKDMNKYELDFAGWDINKTLFNISKGNPDLISWFFSPIIYKKEEKAFSVLYNFAVDFFKPTSAYYHYLHMAVRNYNQYIRNPEGELVNTKKYLYVLRPILACNWIELVGTIPPMRFSNIYDSLLVQKHIGEPVLDEIKQLVFNKQVGLELDKQLRNPILDIFVEKQFARYEILTKTLDIEVRQDMHKIDKTFQQFVKGELL